MPKFELEEIEDMYVYFVHIVGISEGLFWYSEWSFLNNVAANINAFENWKSYAEEKAIEGK